MSPEQSVVAGLAKIGMAIRARSFKEGQGLSPTQGQMLALLRGRPGLGPRKIAEELGITMPTVSDSLAALTRKGFVIKKPAPHDRRAAALTLTRKGNAEAQRAAAWPDFLLGAVETLTAEERRMFLRCVTKMIRALQEERQIPVSRMCVTCRYFGPNRYHNSANPHHCAFTGAPFGDGDLQLDCADHAPAEAALAARNWSSFIQPEEIR